MRILSLCTIVSSASYIQLIRAELRTIQARASTQRWCQEVVQHSSPFSKWRRCQRIVKRHCLSHCTPLRLLIVNLQINECVKLNVSFSSICLFTITCILYCYHNLQQPASMMGHFCNMSGRYMESHIRYGAHHICDMRHTISHQQPILQGQSSPLCSHNF